MKIIQISILLTIIFSLSAEIDCEDAFIDRASNQYYKEISKFEKVADRYISKKILDESNIENCFNYIFVPILTSKDNKSAKDEKTNLLCFVGEKFKNEWTYVIEDSLMVGLIWQLNGNQKDIEYFDKSSKGYLFENRRTLYQEFIKINPEIVFEVYNIPQTLWLIKNNELRILTYQLKNSSITNIEVHTFESFVKELDDLTFEGFKNSRKIRRLIYK